MPVVAARIGSIGAVVGEAVARFDLHGVREMAMVMADVSGDVERRRTMRRKGWTSAAGFGRRRTAAMMATMVSKVAER
jgi:hypothetical protein